MKQIPILVLVAGLAAAPAAAQDVGRLFFTPEQRASLDARRKARVPDKPSAQIVTLPTTRLDGYVTRSGGRSTVWVNGESVADDAPEAPRIRSNEGRVNVTAGDGGPRVGLKPGQILDRSSGEVRDVIGDGEIRVKRREATGR
jgi:hypothetical protein